MIPIDRLDVAAYVRAAAPAIGLDFSPERLAAVEAAFAVVARFAAPALAVNVPPGTEPAPVFRP